jgi:hypothetical protein
VTPARAAFAMKFGILWHLDNQPQIDLVPLANLNQPIENQLPILVAGKIIVGDGKSAECPRPSAA